MVYPPSRFQSGFAENGSGRWPAVCASDSCQLATRLVEAGPTPTSSALVGNASALYLESNEKVRRELNHALFKRLYVVPDGIAGAGCEGPSARPVRSLRRQNRSCDHDVGLHELGTVNGVVVLTYVFDLGAADLEAQELRFVSDIESLTA